MGAKTMPRPRTIANSIIVVPMVRWLTCLFLFTGTAAVAPSSEIIVGNVRVQALSPTLVRVEPKGPRGFEDRTTFMVQSREFDGIPITKENESAEATLLSTTYYKILIKDVVPGGGFRVSSPSGTVLYDSWTDPNTKKQLLHWPAPLQAPGYALA